MTSPLTEALARAQRLRFLCSGNVVRSAFAELYARHRALPLPVDSAATRFHNPEMFSETRAALRAAGIARLELERFLPRHIDELEDDIGDGLVVFGMTREHLARWRSRFPRHTGAFLLLEIQGRREELLDPVLDGVSFSATFAEIQSCIHVLGRLLATSAG